MGKGKRDSWGAGSWNYTFTQMHLPHHFGYSLPAEPTRKTAVLVEAFDGLLGFSEGEGGLPSSVAAAAAMCEAEGGGQEGQHYLVAVLCEMGRSMHAWQSMAWALADEAALPSRAEWDAALTDGRGVDPRSVGWAGTGPSALGAGWAGGTGGVPAACASRGARPPGWMRG